MPFSGQAFISFSSGPFNAVLCSVSSLCPRTITFLEQFHITFHEQFHITIREQFHITFLEQFHPMCCAFLFFLVCVFYLAMSVPPELLFLFLVAKCAGIGQSV